MPGQSFSCRLTDGINVCSWMRRTVVQMHGDGVGVLWQLNHVELRRRHSLVVTSQIPRKGWVVVFFLQDYDSRGRQHTPAAQRQSTRYRFEIEPVDELALPGWHNVHDLKASRRTRQC